MCLFEIPTTCGDELSNDVNTPIQDSFIYIDAVSSGMVKDSGVPGENVLPLGSEIRTSSH